MASTATRTRPATSAKSAPPRLHAVTYCRISSDPTGREAGVERQRKDTDAIAKRESMTVVERLVDNDRSASRYATRDREGWARVMALVEAGALDAVIVYDLDRLVRQPKELERLIDAAERGLTVRTAVGEIDLSTSGGRMVARTLCNVAAHEADRVSERQRNKLRHDAENGRPHWSSRPFGYTLAGEIDPVEATWVHKMASWAAEDRMSANAIANRLNEEGVRTSAGNRWQHMNVKNTLTAPRTAGLREYHGEVIGEASWPAILDRPRWEEVRTAFEMRSYGPRQRRGGRRSILTRRLVRCARCGRDVPPMTRTTAREGYAWRCKKRPTGGCNAQIKAEYLETVVIEAVLVAIEATPIERRGRSERPDDVTALQRQMDQLAALMGEGSIPMSEYLAARRPLAERLSAAEAAEATAYQADTAAALRHHRGGVRAGWEELDTDARRRIIASMVEYVEILPTTRRKVFDPNRVVIHWR